VLAWALASSLALLTAATGSAALLAHLHPERDYTQLRLRIRTWWPIGGGFFAAISINHTV